MVIWNSGKRRIEITGFKTFGVKKARRVVKDKRLTLYNIFGFGLWIYYN